MRGQPPHGAPPGQVIGARYVVERVLEHEPWGWLAAATERGERRRRVVLKLFVPDPAQAVADVRELAEQELGVLVRASSRWGAAHVAAPAETELRAHEGLPLIVLSLVPGASLAERIAGAAPLAEDAALRVGAGVARGLAAIHAAGGYHGALSPEGIVLRGALDPVLRDIGLVKAARALRACGQAGAAGRDAPGEAPGIDARHAAPEQLAGEQVLPASDVYTLGLIVYTLLTGRVPLCGRSAAETRSIRAHLAPPAPRVEGRPVGGRAAELVLRCLERDPERRPSAAEVARALAGKRRAWAVAPTGRAAAVAFTGGAALAAIATGAALVAGAAAPPKPRSASAAAVVSSAAALDEAVRREMLARLLGARRREIPAGTTAGPDAAATSIALPERSRRFRDGAQEGRAGVEQARGVEHTGATITLPHPPQKLAGIGPVKAFASGRVAVVVTADGRTLAWDADAGVRMRAGRPPSNLGTLDVRALAGGSQFPLLVGRDGSVKTWERAGEPALSIAGLSGVTGAAAGPGHVVVRHADGRVSVVPRVPEYRPSPDPVKVEGLSGVVAVAAGPSGASAALEDDGEIWRWSVTTRGSGLLASPGVWADIGRLARVEPLKDAVSVAIRGGGELLALDRGGAVFSLLDGGWKRVEGLPAVTALSAYSDAAAAVDRRGAVWIWGQIGRGDRQIRFTRPARVEGLPPVSAAEIGPELGLAVDKQGSLWVWGAASGCDDPARKERASCR